MKEFYFKNYSIIECSPSVYYPPLVTHCSIHFFHWSKQCWKSSFIRPFRSSTDFHFTYSVDSNLLFLKTDLIFGKRKLSRCTKLCENGMYSSTGFTSVCNTVISSQSSQCQYFAITLKECYASRLQTTVACVHGQACCNFHGMV